MSPRGRPMDAHVARAPEDGVMGGDAPCAFHYRKEMSASSRGWLVPGWAGGKDSQIWPRHYNVATSPYHRPGMATQTKTPNTPGQAGFLSPQKHVNRAGATVFFSHKTPQRGIDQDVTQEVVFFFFFHGNLSHNIII